MTTECNHQWEYIPPHKYRDEKYMCKLCEMDLTVSEFEYLEKIFKQISELEQRAEAANHRAERYRATLEQIAGMKTLYNITSPEAVIAREALKEES